MGEGAEVVGSIIANAVIFPGAEIRDVQLSGAVWWVQILPDGETKLTYTTVRYTW